MLVFTPPLLQFQFNITDIFYKMSMMAILSTKMCRCELCHFPPPVLHLIFQWLCSLEHSLHFAFAMHMVSRTELNKMLLIS